MTNLAVIRQVLATNTNVDVVEEQVDQYLPSIVHPGFVSTIHYRIAPRAPIFAAGDLQAFMVGLFPELTPVEHKDIYETSPTFEYCGTLHFGELQFVDVVGTHTLRRTLVIEDEDYRREARVSSAEDKDEVTFRVTRRITVTVYPCRTVAKDYRNIDFIATKLLPHYMSPADIARFKPPRQRSFLSRLFQIGA